jgi:hypothetical protein
LGAYSGRQYHQVGRHDLAIPEKNHADYLILYAKTSREHSKNGLSDFQKLLMLHDETM